MLFYSKCYTQTWISASDTIYAPINDIIFLKKLMSYNNKLGEVVLKKSINHLWYSTDECVVVFSLFDDRVDIKMKLKMIVKILQGKVLHGEVEDEDPKKKLILKFEMCHSFSIKIFHLIYLLINRGKYFNIFQFLIIFYKKIQVHGRIWKSLRKLKK
jgi:hypothetical protein